MNLIEVQDKLKGLPMQMVDAASKGQIPSVPPYMAAAELAERQRAMQSSTLSQQASQAQPQTTTDTIKQGISALLQQQMQQRQGTQQMAQQPARPPVMAARGGLMSVARFAEGGSVRREGESFADYRKRVFEEEIARSTAAKKAREAASDAERIRRKEALVAERGGQPGDPLIPPSPFMTGRQSPENMHEPTSVREGKAAIDMGVTPTYTGTRLPAGQERGILQQVDKNPELAAFWAAYKARFPDAGTRQPEAEPGLPRAMPAGNGSGRSRTSVSTTEPVEQGIGSLKAAPAPAADSTWDARATKAYNQIGENAPDVGAMQAEAARLADARRKLYDAENKGDDVDFDRLLGAMTGASGAAHPYLAFTEARRKQRVQGRASEPSFELSEAEKAVAAEAQSREALRGYKEGAVKQQGDMARPMAEREMSEAGQDRRNERSVQGQLEASRISAGASKYAADKRLDAVDPQDKAVKDAEAAFARDPEALALKKFLESPMASLDEAKQQKAVQRLRIIQSDKYREFGLTMRGPAPTGNTAADPLGIR